MIKIIYTNDNNAFECLKVNPEFKITCLTTLDVMLS